MEFAITDIETTGGHAHGNSITEVCILVHDGAKVISRFHSLIKPEGKIPYFITGLTGITDAMVADAPSFDEVAGQIFDMLQGRIFVAHSVNFDYSFLKNHLAACGYELKTQKLCTVRLSRQIFPGLSSYGLAKICGNRGIVIEDRHRAHGDAEATAKLFEQLVQHDVSGTLSKFLKRASKEPQLPPNLPKDEFTALPDAPGVYYFLNKKGKVVYVGKAKSLKKRVNSHFSNNSGSAQKQNFVRDVYHIRFTICESEEAALMLETREIKRLWPVHNRAQKHYEPIFGLVDYFDQNGYRRLAIQKLKHKRDSFLHLPNVLEGHNLIRQAVNENALCLRLAGIPVNKHHCKSSNCVCCNTDEHVIEQYNKKVDRVLEEWRNQYATVTPAPTPFNSLFEEV
ncbi:MAG: exonuclease domain-containing protein [Chitinophagales bacterium]